MKASRKTLYDFVMYMLDFGLALTHRCKKKFAFDSKKYDEPTVGGFCNPFRHIFFMSAWKYALPERLKLKQNFFKFL